MIKPVIKGSFPVILLSAAVLPIYILDTDYGWSIVLGFWLPVLVLCPVVLVREGPLMRKAFFSTCLLLLPLTVGFEYLSLYFDIWNFSQEHSRLWGIYILDAPVEEFIFWFGATPLCLLLYLYYRQLFAGRTE